MTSSENFTEMPDEIGGQFTLDVEDFQAFQDHLDARPRAKRNTWIVRGAIVAAVFVQVWTYVTSGYVNWAMAAVIFVSFLAVIVGIPLIQRRAWKKSPLFQQDAKFITTPEGFELDWGGEKPTLTKWTDVKSAADAAQHIYLWLGQIQAIVVPKRAFETPESEAQFLQICQSRSAAQDGS